MITKKNMSITAGVIISIIFLAGSFYKVNFYEFLLSLRNINSYSLLFCPLFICLSYIAKAFMWRITTVSIKNVSLPTLFGGIVVGCMVNGIFPFRAGELFRAQYLSSMTGLRRTTVLSTIFIERVMDVNSLCVLLIASFFWGIHGVSLKIAAVILLVWLIAVVTMIFLVMNSKKLSQKGQKITLLPQRLVELFVNFLAPLNQLREAKIIIHLIIMSLLSWGCIYLSLLALIYYAGVMTKYEAALLLFLFVNLGFLIPAAPASLGVMQLAFWLSLSQFGVPKEEALALSFAYLFVALLFNTSVGLPFFIRAHLWAQRKIINEEQQSGYKSI